MKETIYLGSKTCNDLRPNSYCNMCCKILSNVNEEANFNNYNSQILELYSKIETIWVTVKLESGRKNVTEETQVLNIDDKSTNHSQTITSALNKYFLLPDEKKFVTNNNNDNNNNNNNSNTSNIITNMSSSMQIPRTFPLTLRDRVNFLPLTERNFTIRDL